MTLELELTPVERGATTIELELTPVERGATTLELELEGAAYPDGE